MKPRTSYTVRIFRDSTRDQWTGQLAEEQGCITQGRTIEETVRRMREAAQAWFDLDKPYDGKLVEQVEWPPGVRKVVATANTKRAIADVAAEEAAEWSRRAIDAITATGLSLRDAGHAIGLTRQRAQKLKDG